MTNRTRQLKPTIAAFAAMSALLCTLAGPSGATIEEVTIWLQDAELAGRPAVPLRADGFLIVQVPGTQASRHPIVFLQRENGDTYVETRSPAVRILVLEGGQRSYIVTPEAPGMRPLRAEEQLLDSDFIGDDLMPFAAQRYTSAQIADRGPHQVTLSLTPKKSPYALLVLTMDLDRKTIGKTMYYVGSPNNLVKMRRDLDFALVSGRWRPRMISMEHFQLRTRSILELEWKELGSAPSELFRPEALNQPSSLEWPPPSTPRQTPGNRN